LGNTCATRCARGSIDRTNLDGATLALNRCRNRKEITVKLETDVKKQSGRGIKVHTGLRAGRLAQNHNRGPRPVGN